MKLYLVLYAIGTFFGAASAVAVANAAPAAEPAVVDISDMKPRIRGGSPPPPSPSKREYEDEEE